MHKNFNNDNKTYGKHQRAADKNVKLDWFTKYVYRYTPNG